MSSSYSPNTPVLSKASSAPSQWSASNIFDQEKKVFKNNIPLVLSTSVVTAVYSYAMIEKNVNNAISRALLMALSTFLSASAINLLEVNDYISDVSGSSMSTARSVEFPLTALIYYYITKKQFALPDFNSQALKTGFLASAIGELATPTVSKYYAEWDVTATPTSPTTTTSLSA